MRGSRRLNSTRICVSWDTANRIGAKYDRIIELPSLSNRIKPRYYCRSNRQPNAIATYNCGYPTSIHNHLTVIKHAFCCIIDSNHVGSVTFVIKINDKAPLHFLTKMLLKRFPQVFEDSWVFTCQISSEVYLSRKWNSNHVQVTITLSFKFSNPKFLGNG